MDNLSKLQRSKCMSKIRSKWTQPEKTVHNYLKSRKIRHKMHPKVKGSPDIVLIEKKKAIFLHGCFWHKCPKCFVEPKSRRHYWTQKIEKNVSRDERSRAVLRKQGWSVISIWEHQIKEDPQKTLNRIV